MPAEDVMALAPIFSPPMGCLKGNPHRPKPGGAGFSNYKAAAEEETTKAIEAKTDPLEPGNHPATDADE